jgi:hypothetical protein
MNGPMPAWIADEQPPAWVAGEPLEPYYGLLLTAEQRRLAEQADAIYSRPKYHIPTAPGVANTALRIY